MERLEKIKKIITCDFDIDTHNGKSIILLYFPYSPYKYNCDTAEVDSFYIACNLAYNAAIEYAKRLRAENIACTANPKGDYKAAAHRCGGVMGKNSLIYRKDYGSRFAIAAIELAEPVSGITAQKNGIIMPCEGCDICKKACPVSAIKDSSENFDSSVCMRRFMLKPEKANIDTVKAFGNRLIGCDICQKVCPQNKVRHTEPPQEIQNLLRIENLYNNIIQDDLRQFSQYFGKNYASKNSLLAMLIIAAANIGDKRCGYFARENLDNQSLRVKFAAEYALQISGGANNEC
jgi:epoxyqueuosine reductase QueG